MRNYSQPNFTDTEERGIVSPVVFRVESMTQVYRKQTGTSL